MSFTDDDLKRYKEAAIRTDRDDLCRLLARLEAAELALEDADCDCKGDATVCRFYKRREAWRKVKGEK